MKFKSILVICIVLLAFTSIASAERIDDKKLEEIKEKLKDIKKDSDNFNVKEEVYGLTDDKTDVIIKGTIIHYKDAKDIKSKQVPLRIIPSICSKTFSKWRTLPVSYVVNPLNTQSLDSNFIKTSITNGVEVWDYVTSKNLVIDTYTEDISVSWGVLDGKNAIVFGDNYPDPRVIAVTGYWRYLYSGYIAEFDISMEEDYAWGDASIDTTKMDVQNIFTHEFGHGLGLSDLYTSNCNTQTMYGYSGYGEIIKRTLESGDIYGLIKLYGR